MTRAAAVRGRLAAPRRAVAVRKPRSRARPGRGAAGRWPQRQWQIELDPTCRRTAASRAGPRRSRGGRACRRQPRARPRAAAVARALLLGRAASTRRWKRSASRSWRTCRCGCCRRDRQSARRWRASPRRRAALAARRAAQCVSMPTVPSGSHRADRAHLASRRRGARRSHQPLARRLAAAGAWPMIWSAHRARRAARIDRRCLASDRLLPAGRGVDALRDRARRAAARADRRRRAVDRRADRGAAADRAAGRARPCRRRARSAARFTGVAEETRRGRQDRRALADLRAADADRCSTRVRPCSAMDGACLCASRDRAGDRNAGLGRAGGRRRCGHCRPAARWVTRRTAASAARGATAHLRRGGKSDGARRCCSKRRSRFC